MIAILFFSIAAAICVQIFAKSHELSTKADIESHAVRQVKTTAELLLGNSEGVESTLTGYNDKAVSDDEGIHYYYNDKWEFITKDENPIYRMDITQKPVNSGVTSVTMKVIRIEDNEEEYTLTLDCRTPGAA